MISYSEFEYIKEKIFKLFDYKTDVKFELVEDDGVFVSYNGETAKICASVKTNTARALSLFVKNIREKNCFEVKETKHFQSLGFGLDVSRNAVMTVESAKKYIDVLASLGFDALMIYMEDTFELEGYPYFGYRRGRYTIEELKEIDDYGYSLGVEIVPSVQTLGHMEQYFKWKEAAEIMENANVMLCGEEKTYIFIDKVLGTMRKAFRTKRININCDEAGGIGRGAYLAKHPYTEKKVIVKAHLERVMALCDKYGFEPMISGDLYIKHFMARYYDFSKEIPKDHGLDFPDMEILYWDYYHTEYEDYKEMMRRHKLFGQNITYYGGIWTWCGLLPNIDFTVQTMLPALSVALDEKVKNVWAVSFGDDGSETNMRFAIPALAIFSEKCFKGGACTMEDINEMSEHTTGIDFNAFRALSHFHYPFVEGLTKFEYIWPNYMGKKIFYTDLLYNFTNTYEFDKILAENQKGYAAIKDVGIGTEWEMFFDYARGVYEVTLEKIRLIQAIKNAYVNGEKEVLSKIAENDIPKLIELFKRVHGLSEALWMSTNKVFGWEELDGRFGAVVARLEYDARVLKKYADGTLPEIQELEYDFIEYPHGAYHYGGVALYKDIKATCR